MVSFGVALDFESPQGCASRGCYCQDVDSLRENCFFTDLSNIFIQCGFPYGNV